MKPVVGEILIMPFRQVKSILFSSSPSLSMVWGPSWEILVGTNSEKFALWFTGVLPDRRNECIASITITYPFTLYLPWFIPSYRWSNICHASSMNCNHRGDDSCLILTRRLFFVSASNDWVGVGGSTFPRLIGFARIRSDPSRYRFFFIVIHKSYFCAMTFKCWNMLHSWLMWCHGFSGDLIACCKIYINGYSADTCLSYFVNVSVADRDSKTFLWVRVNRGGGAIEFLIVGRCAMAVS